MSGVGKHRHSAFGVYVLSKALIAIVRDLRLIKVPVASTSLSQRWLSEVEAI